MSASTIRSEIDWKLHHLARPVHSGVLALAKRPKDAEAKARSQRSADAKIWRSKIKRSKKLGLESESGGLRLVSSRPELEDK